MREVLVCDLIKNILGPRGGPREILTDMPLVEYITGILAPVGAEAERRDEPGSDSELAGAPEGKEGDAATEPDISPSSVLSPALDPKKIPSTMGMTFSASASGAPEIDVCVTWARYLQAEDAKRWKRIPKHAIFSLGDDSEVRWFDSDGNEADGDGEISVHVRVDRGARARSVSIYVVNRIKVPRDKKPTSDHHVFQPQIRIACGRGTEIVPRRCADAASQDEKEDEVLYEKKRSLARGHMTSVVWKDVDPEIGHPDAELDFPECAAQPGFAWADAEILPAESRARFASCDARTEFVPMHSVMSPDFSWPGENPPPLKPAEYAEECDGEALRRRLEPFDLQYQRWIDDLRNCEVKHEGVKSKIVRAAEDAHRRIKLGIDLICGDGDARLAFCFANRAIDEQAKWAGREDMEFRPFQLGFILMSAESVLNRKSEDRGTCDLLWVPTGGGKTEAYLFLVAMVSAHRRLKAAKSALSQRSGEGVAIISRYTLRLLTIQQFRRTAALFAAMECLRVEGLGGGDVGWRPKGMRGGGDFLWGTAPFSVGLWVGKTVTPNSLTHTWRTRKVPGALDILKDSDERVDYGEPAQILECPACRSVLATPKMGLKNKVWIHYVVSAETGKMDAAESLAKIKAPYVEILESKTTKNRADKTFTVSVNIRSASPIRDGHLDGLWSLIEKQLSQDGSTAKLAAASPSRPGYFVRHYAENGKKEYDFEIFCPNPDCVLVRNWAGGYHLGRVHGRIPSTANASESVCGAQSPDGNRLADVIGAFAAERNLSDRVPIPALTVDDQVYRTLPTMVVSTVDKLARIPFEPRAGALFGNVDHHNCVSGYYRYTGSHPKPAGGREKNYAKLDRKPRPPDLIIQDELHLVDGPLGSMVGAYETAVDHLCGSKAGIKYIASTATAKRSDDHVRALFDRKLAVFPPKGLDVDDRFFLRERRAHPLQDKGAGRLYVGICAPGSGALKPIVRAWSRLAQSAGEQGGAAGADPFWTIVGYFNTVRELAGARALYRQDIPEWMRHLASLSGSKPRDISEEGGQELSGRTPSTDLPYILDLLDQKHPESKAALDGLFTTSMFGTGVDVQRLGAMLVNGQPKTSSAYIQSTGRVGRKSGAVVVTLHRASKPRDLNHYEFFVRHHSQLHRFVEPPTVFPFAKRVREIAQGPVMVGMLRNARDTSNPWAKSPGTMNEHGDAPEVDKAPKILEARSQRQPPARRPPGGETEDGAQRAIEDWKRHAKQDSGLEYADYRSAETPVVLGDPKHEHSGARVVYSNAPQSMRSIEEETRFQT